MRNQIHPTGKQITQSKAGSEKSQEQISRILQGWSPLQLQCRHAPSFQHPTYSAKLWLCLTSMHSRSGMPHFLLCAWYCIYSVNTNDWMGHWLRFILLLWGSHFNLGEHKGGTLIPNFAWDTQIHCIFIDKLGLVQFSFQSFIYYLN